MAHVESGPVAEAERGTGRGAGGDGAGGGVRAELIEDRKVPGQFRVEANDDDGGCEVAIFCGPNALDRAIAFAGGSYYDGWDDPEGWSTPDRN